QPGSYPCWRCGLVEVSGAATASLDGRTPGKHSVHSRSLGLSRRLPDDRISAGRIAAASAKVRQETEVKDMAKNIKKIAAGLGARVVGKVPHTGGGAFGAARLARIVAAIQAHLVPGQARRPG